ncbi:MAG: DUF434 domain-containing protein [Bacteroidetes bacterium QH_10_64_19]|nr:MAG: DUF434 domain-containing protein [Bacteroidetes bacterium QH_10_64_19]
MPSNRGPHPEDPEQFGPDQYERLRAAVRDLSWLRSRGYSGGSTQKLVGDRYQLKRRQRNAVARSACRDARRAHRLRARCSPAAVAGRELHVDAFNVLITVEAALGGAYLFVGRDTAYRDVDPLKGTYRIVQQTDPALALLADTVSALNLEAITWHLDDSVSNVGRVRARLRHVASERGLAWRLVQEDDVDATLCDVTAPVVTSDSAILDATTAWLHLEALVHRRHVPSARVVDLRPDGERTSRDRGAH